jgi:predicted nucleotidyltransferase
MKDAYLKQIKQKIREFDSRNANRYFVFGSSMKGGAYHDIDLGVIGNKKSGRNLAELKDLLYDSTISYRVDVVDFDDADLDFSSYVLNKEPILWIR